MKLFIYCLKKDWRIRTFCDTHSSNVYATDIRDIVNTVDPNYAVGLLSYHWTNTWVIEFMRRHSILIPIFIIGDKCCEVVGSNGWMHPNALTYEALALRIQSHPQEHIWKYVFERDKQKRLAHQQDKLGYKNGIDHP